jgi:protein-L-isoaspartate(D-aspartate) O-methyltransferase
VRRLSVLWMLAVLATLPSAAAAKAEFGQQRAALVREIIQTAATDYPGFERDPHFVAAVGAVGRVPREAFVPTAQRANAYRDTPLSIGYDQTISDPYIVTIMTAAVGVTAGSHVLEIGTGSGYQAAVLSQLGASTHTIEIVEPLAKRARATLTRLKAPRVSVMAGDGFAGWEAFAPYDMIIVTAGADKIPAALIAQLKRGGKLVMPIGAQRPFEQLILLTKNSDTAMTRCSLGPALFVPLAGRGARSDAAKGLYDRTIPNCYAGQRATWP